MHLNGDDFGLSLYNLVAGFAGGVVKMSNSEPVPVSQWLGGLLTATLVAGYITPLLMNYIDVPPSVQFSCAFIVGLSSLQIIKGILKTVERIQYKEFFKGDKRD